MTILFEPSRQWSQHLAPLLGGGVHTAGTLDDVHRLLAEYPHELLVLFGPSTDMNDALSFGAQQRVNRPTLGVVLLRDQIDVGTLNHALRAGVREVVEAGDVNGVLAACARSVEVSRQLAGTAAPTVSAGDARVVTVFSAKGGCGKTTLATNIAVALADGGHRRVCLVDLDLAFGDVGIMMQLTPDRGIGDAIDARDRIDATMLRALLTPYSPGLDVLLAPVGPAEAERVSRDVVVQLLGAAQTMFDYVVIDTPAQFTDHVLTALDLSHLHVLLTTPDIPALKNLRIALDMFDLLNLPKENRIVVLNRSDARVGLTGADIERVIQSPINAHVPSSRDVPVSINRGVPIVVDKPTHPVSRAIRDLAVGRLAKEAGPRAGRSLRERFGRSESR
jgi:Flp pilus assembly CpaE family ATPase